MKIDKIMIQVRESILNERFYYMGLAMICVILYHMYNITSNNHCIFNILDYGHIGVDIFFFFSALGLCFSLSKKPLTNFYKKRIIRIYPLFFVWSLLYLYSEICIKNGEVTFFDVACLFSTISYYGLGTYPSNWYLSALMVFYFAFPIVYKLCVKYKYIGIFIILLTLSCVTFFDFRWQISAFISRSPILYFGVGVYLYYKKEWDGKFINRYLVCNTVILLSVLVLTIITGTIRYQFLLTTLATPYFLFLLFSIRKIAPPTDCPKT